MAVALPIAMRSPLLREAHSSAHHGFTLLEILVVIALISLLTTAVAVGAMTMLEKAKIEQAKNDTATLASVAEASLVMEQNETCPTVAELRRDGLLSRRTNTEDPWGTPYRLECEPGYPIAISAGPDSTFDTDDDVKSEP
jgi:general secretion pathway protein G